MVKMERILEVLYLPSRFKKKAIPNKKNPDRFTAAPIFKL
jgi:hypothetical protein